MPGPPNTTLAGLLLSGGASSRFGAPKADAQLAGKTLARVALDRLKAICGRIAIAGPALSVTENLTHLPDPPDLPRGPLSGILAGLEWAQAANAHWLVVSPCDMPLLPPSTHRDLVNAAQAARAPLAILTSEDGPNPLCSVWSPQLAHAVRKQLDRGYPPIWRYAEELGAASLRLNDPAMALNINTPQDLQKAAELTDYHWWRRGHAPKD